MTDKKKESLVKDILTVITEGVSTPNLALSMTADHTIMTPIEVTTETTETTKTTTLRMGDQEVIQKGITMSGAAEKIIVEGVGTVKVLAGSDW